MANRFPLVVDSSALQIKEIPANDNLDLANSSIVNVVDITASGNVSIGGTLTYEDVTNIDSVGIITAQAGIKVLAGGINAVGVVVPILPPIVKIPLGVPVKIPSASVVVTLVSPRLTAFPAVASSLSKLVTIRTLLAPVVAVSLAKFSNKLT